MLNDFWTNSKIHCHSDFDDGKHNPWWLDLSLQNLPKPREVAVLISRTTMT